MPLDLEAIGLTAEDVQERVITRISEQISEELDREGILSRAQQNVHKHIDTAVQEIGAEHVLPLVSKLVEGVCLQETNQWGEKVGKSQTFTEYLVARADAYMSELVDYEGKPKGRDSYSWSGKQTRLTFLIHQHLQYSIDTAVKNALQDFNSKLGGALAETVKIQLQTAIAGLKVSAVVAK